VSCRLLGTAPLLQGQRTYARPLTLVAVHQGEALAAARLVELPRRWLHGRGVAAVASSVARRLDPDNAEAIIAAAWRRSTGGGGMRCSSAPSPRSSASTAAPEW
jgi:hypothetical protein